MNKAQIARFLMEQQAKHLRAAQLVQDWLVVSAAERAGHAYAREVLEVQCPDVRPIPQWDVDKLWANALRIYDAGAAR